MLDRWVRFRLADPDRRYRSVRVELDRAVPAKSRAMRRRAGCWELRVPRPALWRMEYQYVVRERTGAEGDDAQERWVLDPGNPRVVDTGLGQKSVVELPGYRAPQWLGAEAVPGTYTALEVEGETGDRLPVTMWAPAGSSANDPMPLLMVHDGPEYDLLASLTRYCGAQVASGALPQHRVALLHPVERNAWYSGSPGYLSSAAGAGLGRLREAYAVSAPVAVMGASLGGLTALLAGLLGAPGIGAVFSQSGSFFRVVHDRDSVGDFRYFGRISRKVEAILAARHTLHPLRVGMTCGAMEENAANNRDMAAALARAGHRVDYAEVPDLHSYTAWRDALDPILTTVLQDCWGAQG